MTSEPIDYARLDEGRACNYWSLDRTLQSEARRIYPEVEFEWAEPLLSEFGAILGHELADTADRIDEVGHELHSFDKYGERLNEVEYHPSFASRSGSSTRSSARPTTPSTRHRVESRPSDCVTHSSYKHCSRTSTSAFAVPSQ